MEDHRAASILASIENANANNMHGFSSIAATEIIHHAADTAGLMLNADQNLYTKAATYNTDESDNNNCMQMGSTGAAAAISSSAYVGPAVTSPVVSELTNNVDNEIMHGHNNAGQLAAINENQITGGANGKNGNIINAAENMISSTKGSNYNHSASINGNNNGAAMACSTVNPGRKRSRSAPWSVVEMLALIDAKRNERQQSMSYKTRGLKLPGAEKWKLVSRYLESKEMERSGSQCQDKWENMMKDYKAVRDWQTQHSNNVKDDHTEGGCRGRNYFKHMTNKERKEARLPPQMDEVIFSSLQAIQHEKEEQRRASSIGSLSLPKPFSSSSASLVPDYHQLYQHCPKNQHIFPVDVPHGNQHLNLNTHPFTTASTDHSRAVHAAPPTTHSNNNMQHRNDFVRRLIDTHKEEITCTTQLLQENTHENKASCNRILPSSPRQLAQHLQNGSQAEHIKETATLVQVLVALADAVKTVAQKL